MLLVVFQKCFRIADVHFCWCRIDTLYNAAPNFSLAFRIFRQGQVFPTKSEQMFLHLLLRYHLQRCRCHHLCGLAKTILLPDWITMILEFQHHLLLILMSLACLDAFNVTLLLLKTWYLRVEAHWFCLTVSLVIYQIISFVLVAYHLFPLSIFFWASIPNFQTTESLRLGEVHIYDCI